MKYFLLFLLFPALAFAAPCTTITWTNPDAIVNNHKILYGPDQNSLVEKCNPAGPITTYDCSLCGDLATFSVGVVGVQNCNNAVCASVGVGALPADPPPTQPAPATGVAAQ